jgi:hypothetical protein
MGHHSNYQNNVTSLEDLDLYDIDERGAASCNSAIRPAAHNQPDENKITNKYIRPHHVQHQDSGMNAQEYPQGPPVSMEIDSVPYNGGSPYMKPSLADKVESGHSPSCLRVADHVSECRMCSTFYNPDRTLYIIIIVVLSIICILLLKRVLDI